MALPNREPYVHPVCKQMRDLRRAAGLSLNHAEELVGLSAIVLGSYERGDRQPPIAKAETILNGYGYTLVAVPKDFNAVRLPADIAEELRAIANQLDKKTQNALARMGDNEALSKRNQWPSDR